MIAFAAIPILALTCLQNNFFPSISRGAQEVLMRYYELQRRTDTRSAARTTLRLLESLVRLAQAHARLMCRQETTVQDAAIAVMLVETSMHTSLMMSATSVLHATASASSDVDFAKQQLLILRRLGINETEFLESAAALTATTQKAAAPDDEFADVFRMATQPDPKPSTQAPFHVLSMFSAPDPLIAAKRNGVPPAILRLPTPSQDPQPPKADWYHNKAIGQVPPGHVDPQGKTLTFVSKPLARQLPAIFEASAPSTAIQSVAAPSQPPIHPLQPAVSKSTQSARPLMASASHVASQLATPAPVHSAAVSGNKRPRDVSTDLFGPFADSPAGVNALELDATPYRFTQRPSGHDSFPKSIAVQPHVAGFFPEHTIQPKSGYDDDSFLQHMLEVPEPQQVPVPAPVKLPSSVMQPLRTTEVQVNVPPLAVKANNAVPPAIPSIYDDNTADALEFDD
jgi:hypothetical protein